jgi:hypothetical protein
VKILQVTPKDDCYRYVRICRWPCPGYKLIRWAASSAWFPSGHAHLGISEGKSEIGAILRILNVVCIELKFEFRLIDPHPQIR